MKNLGDPVSILKGVGEKTAVSLNKLGINTIMDLLTYFPRRYDDLSLKNLNQAVDGQKVTVKGIVATNPVLSYFGRHRSRLSFRIKINDDIFNVTFFNQPWLKKQIELEKEVIVFGSFDRVKNKILGMKILNSSQENSFNSVYPSIKEIRQNTIKKLILQAYQEYQEVIPELIPDKLINKYRLEPFKKTIHNMHFPKNQVEAQKALRTAKFDEFFIFSMKMQILKNKQRKKDKQAEIAFNSDFVKKFIHRLTFKLTDAQKKATDEILADLKSPYPMNRLLQGDVGSGKTVVAAACVAATVSAGKQAAIMAPTEILAEQHANNFARVFSGLGINIGLLTGSTSQAARKELLPRIANGEINFIVGTHALFQNDIQYHDLGLAIIDEQHRFGVNQRRAFRVKGDHTNVLAMTATPIPRTLAITMYGDMDVSIIDQLPAGRKPVKTTWISAAKTNSAVGFVNKQLKLGHQAYVVTPLIEESDAVDMKNAIAIHDRFKAIFEPKYKVGLLHGQMTSEQKEDVMVAFKNNEFQILVATTVIEVGVDVANANTMVIFDADHFGLSQLHQLRGRVGRSSDQSYCILIADPTNKIGKQRMKAISTSTNGFFLSQKDLELRGQGDVTGSKQSGMPDFKVGDPIGDLNILSVATQEAAAVVSDNNWQSQPQNVQLAQYLRINQKILTD